MRPYAKGRRVKGSAGVMAIVLAEIVAGAAALLWFVPLWREVKRGFFTLMGAILLVLSLLMLLSSSSGVMAGDAWGRWSMRLGILTVVVIALGTALLAARRHAAGRVLGMLSAAVATSVLGAL